MKTLLLETSTEKALVALFEKKKNLAEKRLSGGAQLSKNLALEVARLLGDIRPDQIAIGQGPGSYTGIRVAAALGQGLSLGWEIPIFGFCSLEAFCPTPEHAVLVDARSGGVYLFFQGKSQKVAIDDPLLSTFPLLASPHPALLQKRISLPGQWIETDAEATRVHLSPLSLQY